ncbi:MAG: hypothetical protein M1355_00480 [Patescibacteria group bacterium]|nr:hypothetical protein [Patescibacteria group bacterium]
MSGQEKSKSFLKEYKIPIITAGVIFILGGTTVGASNSAGPGDLLYPVDLKLEAIQGSWINNSQGKLDFTKAVLEERKEEKNKIKGDEVKEKELDEKIEEAEDEIEEIEAAEAPETPESKEDSKKIESNEGTESNNTTE